MKWFSAAGLERGSRFLWALVLLAFPVTSFRFLPFLGAGTQVRPLSFLPAALLLLLLGVRSLQQRRLLFWQDSLLPLLVFLFVALFSTAAGFFLAPPDMFQNTYPSRALRAWFTLGIGLTFLLVSVGMNRDEGELHFTLKWLYASFAIQVAWSLVQVFVIYAPLNPLTAALREAVNSIQETLFFAQLAPNRRISGLTLEPSWLAAQVTAVYLPWAFAALLKGYRWQPRRWLAPLILVAGGILLVFTFSRSGVLVAVAAMSLTFLFTGGSYFRQAWHWFLAPFRSIQVPLRYKAFHWGIRTLLSLVILGSVVGGVFLLAQNNYFSQIWRSDKTDLVSYFVDIYAGPRLAYAWTGWTIYSQHPWTGVGLGAAGFYFRDALPDWAHFNMSEISVLLAPEYRVYPNTKNLYIRLLSETGLFGFFLFLSFYLALLGKVIHLLRSSRRDLVFTGVAGLFSWLVIVALGLSQDSLASAVIWLPLGILMGMVGQGETNHNCLTDSPEQARSPKNQV